jgi:hypothetical protein
MGNSEVGHLNIGAGRVVDQAYTSTTLSTPARSRRTTPSPRRLNTSNTPADAFTSWDW